MIGRSLTQRRVCFSALALLLCWGCGHGPSPAHSDEAAQRGTPLRAYPPAVALRPDQLDPPGFWTGHGAGAGLWTKTPVLRPGQAEKALEAIGYAQGFEAVPTKSGVFVHDAGRVQPGPNFYVSGHAPEAILMAQDGTRIHEWHFSFADIPNAPEATDEQAGCWRRAVPLEDGTLFAIHEGIGLLALDKDSHLLWFHPGAEHHDLSVQPDGTIVVLARRSRILPDIHPDLPVLEDLILWLGPDGEELRRLSLLDAWRNSSFRAALEHRPYLVGDITHTNSLEVLDGSLAHSLPAFRAGNLLLSARMLNAIFVVDPNQGRVVWCQQGPWLRQHDASSTGSGTLLLFDNRGYRGASQVLEFDPLSLRENWAYRGNPPSSFDSIFLGAAQRLANGNTLITEGCAGRAFEVTTQGETVWEFVSGHRAGEDDELVAALFDVVRMPLGFGASW